MNNDRRKRLDAITSCIQGLVADLECVRDEEQEAYDNMPEGLQQGERGQDMEESIARMDDALSSLGDAESGAEDAKQ